MSERPVDQDIIDLYDEFTHGDMDRRAFLQRLAGLAGSVAAAYTLLPLLENDYARAEVVKPDDPRLTTAWVDWPGGAGRVRGYLVKPRSATGPLPCVVVIHENRGLNPHIQDVARRAALAGFLALAPDGLSSQGGTPEDSDAARELFRKLDRDASLADFTGAAAYLRAHAEGNGKVGCVGFCWGGGMANRMAVADPDLRAAVPFYGSQAPVADVPLIQAALQLHYAEKDERINAGIRDFVTALNAARVRYELHVYPGTQHAFHNDTNAARHDPAAARLAWARTLDFLRERLA